MDLLIIVLGWLLSKFLVAIKNEIVRMLDNIKRLKQER